MDTIETERLLLRPWKIDDAAEAASLFRYASDPEIGLRCGWPPHTSVEGSMHDIRNILAVENNWAITIKGGAPNSNAPVGSIALKPVSHRTADAVAADPELTKRYGKYRGARTRYGAATTPRTRNPGEFRPSAACTSSPSRNRIISRSSTVTMTASTASSPRANGAMPNTGRWRGIA